MSLTNWLSPSAMHSLGWTLLHFLWQGTAVAALAAVLMTACRRASTRYVVGVVALLLMLATPVGTFLFLSPLFLSPSSAAAPARFSSAPQTGIRATINPSPSASAGISYFSPLPDALPWLVEAWLLGVAFFSLRSAGGFLLLERERRKQSTNPSARVLTMCQMLQQRLGLERAVRYCECKWLQAPAVIGWFRPIVLLPVAALTGLSEEQLESVIAHELAHIQRLDAFVNVFQISVETLLFYHPAVWWLNKRIRAEREHCCDDVAVALCGNPVQYARALTLMEEWRSAPALAMAANHGPLAERIFRVLGVKSGSRGMGLTGGLLCLTAALFAGNALFGIAYPKPTVHASEKLIWAAVPVPQSSPAPASAPTPAAKPSPARPAAAPQPAAGGSYIDGMKAVGFDNLTVDQLIAMKIQGITPEYIRGLQEQGLHPDRDHLLGMRIQGVTPEYVHDLHGLGLNPDGEQIVGMKIQGIDAAYVRGLQEAGVQFDIRQLIVLKIQGVTPAYVRGLHEQGLQPEANQLIGMRIQGVTPEYVRDIRALGLTPTASQFISMRIQGVTPEYIKGLQAAGLKVDVEDIIRAKIQDITPEFIERAAKHGFQNLTLDKLIQLKHVGILESPADL
ncbi:MAG: M56 family metallopeptidase [Candidatus Sulfotelmatobacter sp.]|jgi:bla regulator protein blaR1